MVVARQVMGLMLGATLGGALFLGRADIVPEADAAGKCGCEAKFDGCTAGMFFQMMAGKPATNCFEKRRECLSACQDKKACLRECRSDAKDDIAACEAEASKVSCGSQDQSCKAKRSQALNECKRMARAERRDCRKDCRS